MFAVNSVSNYRRFKGLTQSDVAKLLGISLQSYSRKELEKVPFNDKEKIFILNLFKDDFPDLTIDKLFFNLKVPNC